MYTWLGTIRFGETPARTESSMNSQTIGGKKLEIVFPLGLWRRRQAQNEYPEFEDLKTVQTQRRDILKVLAYVETCTHIEVSASE